MELSPDWVVGFVDGEGCFHVSVNENPKTKLGYQVLPEFVVVQHQRDVQVLYALKSFFKCGVVRKNNGDRWCYRVRKLECLRAICEFFVKHPLKTKKNVDRIKFCRVVGYMLEGRHLSLEGLLEIVEIALQMNTKQRDALLRIKRDLEAKVRYSPPPLAKVKEKGERNSLSGKRGLARVRLISGEPSYPRGCGVIPREAHLS
jgi:hypothetical protein